MDQIRVVFLGTSAGTPTRERNVASIAMLLDGRVLLFDCGEATQHQLLRAPVRTGALEAIFITHLHGDHLFGLPGLLATLGLQGRGEPLDVYGPPGLARYLAATPYAGRAYPVTVHEIASAGEVRRADGYRVIAALLDHAAPCFGFAVIEDDRPGAFDVDRATSLGVPAGPLFRALQQGNDVTLAGGRVVRSAEVMGPPRAGRRIVYCTDTRPCDAAIELARDADLLIHESTYASELAAEAAERFHSTATEAAEVARAADARRLVLTHISPRYADAAPLVDEARAVFAETTAAADLIAVEVPRPRVIPSAARDPEAPGAARSASGCLAPLGMTPGEVPRR